MNIYDTFKTILITILVMALFALNFVANKFFLHADSVYKVYLDGNVIGYIQDDEELYKIINHRQKVIKEKYSVDRVYPPENIEIIKTNSFNVEISSAQEIYNKMAELGSFTVIGYTISISNDEGIKDVINVLDKDIFEKSIYNFVYAFIDEEEYNDYINNTQKEIETTGKTIELMYFDESISIKQGYININDKIYTSENDLTQHLLFGNNYTLESYKIQSGDTIESISENNKLNPEEFLIANPQYASASSLLTIGDIVNITLLNPILTFSYDVNEVSDTTIPYEKKTTYDSTKPYSYSEITTAGVNGVTRITQEYVVKNGETQSGVIITNQETLIEKVDEITTRGGYSKATIRGQYVDDGTVWGWPTNQPSVITSLWAWRWGEFHDGIDISGTGYGSPLYASLDGEVVASGYGGMVGSAAGYNVVIKHDNGYYTVYGHMVPNSMTVKVGDRVIKGQIIGSMGHTGVAYGTHVHFALWYGVPYGGGKSINPCTLWVGRC